MWSFIQLMRVYLGADRGTTVRQWRPSCCVRPEEAAPRTAGCRCNSPGAVPGTRPVVSAPAASTEPSQTLKSAAWPRWRKCTWWRTKCRVGNHRYDRWFSRRVCGCASGSVHTRRVVSTGCDSARCSARPCACSAVSASPRWSAERPPTRRTWALRRTSACRPRAWWCTSESEALASPSASGTEVPWDD